MQAFLGKFAGVVRGVLSGLDRVFLSGRLRGLAHTAGLRSFLWNRRVLLKDFGDYCQQVSTQVHEASLHEARHLGREIRYLNSGQYCKEDIAHAIAARDHIKQGLICVLRSVDPCMSFQIVPNAQSRKLEVRYRPRKCLHLYHYQIHPVFGFMHARIQTWFPFHVYVCLNGREWLARQMDHARLRYVRRDNTFTWLQDLAQAQALLDAQLHADWPGLLDPLAAGLNPAHTALLGTPAPRYYWSVADSEWASDVLFHTRKNLENVYPQLVRHAVLSFGTAEVLRFFGQPVPVSGRVPHRCRHEVSTNVRERLEGVRLKHWFHNNNLKLYDKGSVLRAECTLRQPEHFRVYRSAEGHPEGPQDWRPLRKGVVDLAARAAVSHAANERYLQALAAVHLTVPLHQVAEPLCRPAPASARRVRALNPLAADDARLLQAVSRHEFMLEGLRNRDLRALLFGAEPVPAHEQRRRSAVVTRKLRLLRAHGLLDKVPHTHRYVVTEQGRQAITALLAARNASTQQLLGGAA